ncbi:MAG: sigma-70 family RNA polymerase sigma factor [Gemmatimonadetes bacterium]|nr:sigma-70 family RNA polymerase sigma factor [Gemmatimonadota bacterium]
MEFEPFFRRVYPSLFRYLHRLTGDEDVAADLAQEAFLRLLRQPLPEDEAKPWLFTVATNLVRDGVRKTVRRQRLLEAVRVGPVPALRPDETMERDEEIRAVRSALLQLPARDREILLMREEGFKYGDIARAVGVASSSVGTLLARAVRRFSEAYRAQGDGHAPPG